MDAMEKLGSLETDLIIVDLNMPNMDGISFVKNLRNSYYNPDLPVVMLTTTSDEELKEEALKAGVNMFLNKPIQPEVLVHKIESLLDGGA
jgi:two-component system chemotaxis response regulator CheY